MKPHLSPLLLLVCGVLAAGLFAAEHTPPADLAAQIATLRSELARHDDLYHRKATPEISDAEYDRLKQRLRDLERAYPEAARAAPPLPEIGDDRSGLFATHAHGERMLSLEKAFTPAELRAFDARVTRALHAAAGSVEYVIEPKIDGVAVSLTYENGILVRALTRGNGSEGDDITAHVLHLPDLPRRLLATQAAPALIELRGEIFVPFAEFARVNAERELAGEPAFANPRNLAAGTLRQLDGTEVRRRGLRLVVFAVGACTPAEAASASQAELHARLAHWGLPVLPRFWPARGAAEMLAAVTSVDKARAGLAFPIDGAVVKVDRFAQQRELGASDAAPRWAIAFKFAPERAETRVRAISLQVGRTGVLTPVAELDPVRLAGSVVARATLHNADELARRDVRIGDFVFLEKAGEIIPAIVGVNRERRSAASQPFAFPIACPECREAVVRRAGEVAIRCMNSVCPARLRRQLEHFVSPAALDIPGLGPAAIEALVRSGRVARPGDLYRLSRSELRVIPRSSDRSAERLLHELEQSKRAELWRVIHALGVPQVGAVAAKELARTHRDLRALAAADARFHEAVEDLLAVGFAPAEPATRVAAAGKIFVLTGSLPALTRAQATALIEGAGGTVAPSVTRATDYLVAGSDPGGKLAQARAAGATILDEAGLRRLLAGD